MRRTAIPTPAVAKGAAAPVDCNSISVSYNDMIRYEDLALTSD